MTDRYYIGRHSPGIGELVTLDSEESHHLVRVMRIKEGEVVRLFGGGREFEGRVERLRPTVRVRIEQELAPISPLQIRLHVAVPWLRGGRTEFLLQKLTELGVEKITVYLAARCVARGDVGKLERLERVVIESSKQCERADVPEVQIHGDLASVLSSFDKERLSCIALAERASAPRLSSLMRSWLETIDHPSAVSGIGIVSGPEGGFAPEELAELEKQGTLASLGPRIFRADFAPLVATAVILAQVGEL